MPRPSTSVTQVAKSIDAIDNNGYFSDYFLAYRLDSGLEDLYKRWNELEREGEPTSRTKIRGLNSPMERFRSDAAQCSFQSSEGFDRGDFPASAIEGLRSLNDALLAALGWEANNRQIIELISGDRKFSVPVASQAVTPSGLLLYALETVFATDPATVVAGRRSSAGALLDPITIGERAVAVTVLEAAQEIFSADQPPTYLLVVSGGSVVLLDRDRWGEGVYLGANIDDALARNDVRPKGELAAIAALFSADAINPGEEASSYLTSLLERAANESAGVSKELRQGVRRSVELLARAVIHDVRYRQKGAWRKIDAEDLTKQCLRYIYRIIVLLFAEARPELGILPVNDIDYQSGYSLARLRDVALVDLSNEQSQNATHIQRSLEILFTLVNNGYSPESTLSTDVRGLEFPGLRSSLFAEDACPDLDRSQLTDATLQQILDNLCFTSEQRGRTRHALSYATLGINQLGAVYEGLMAYKGFLATEALYEIDDDANSDNGSWVVPVSKADEFANEFFLTELGPDGQPKRVRYEDGDFVFRLSGRDRQRSASYYTPEVLTEFAVRHTLDVYFNEHPDLSAHDILQLTICEPALGSGAFLNEAINQLAARYLKAAQDEVGETIDAESYQLELQKAKAHFAINQSYGVDLNSTAIELAQVSLWLNCMHPGLDAPNFTARLRQGNSLIGARRATYTLAQVRQAPWRKKTGADAIPPTDQPLSEIHFEEIPGIHHFILPGEGWGAAAYALEIKGRRGGNPVPGWAAEWCELVRNWRTAIQKPPTSAQLKRLEALAKRVEATWKASAVEVRDHMSAHDYRVDVWGRTDDLEQDPLMGSRKAYLPSDSPTARLRVLMNAWCALWMWAPDNGSDLPSMEQWLDAVELLLGQPSSDDLGVLFPSYESTKASLDSVEYFGKASVDEVLEHHPWLKETEKISRSQAFFHWELDQVGIFLSGGFDIQVGNPPWVRLDWNESASLAEFDPWWGITDLTQTGDRVKQIRRELALLNPSVTMAVCRDRAENEGLTSLLASSTREPILNGLRTNLYMVFMTNSWRRAKTKGAVGLIHPESHFVDPKAGHLRAQTYLRLRRHWQFNGANTFFEGVKSPSQTFGVNIYGAKLDSPLFLQSSNLVDVRTLELSLTHDGVGDLPCIQFPEGGLDKRPHLARIITVNDTVLASWVRLFDEPGTPPLESRLIRPLTTADLGSLEAFAKQSKRLGDSNRFWTSGFNEKLQKDDGTMEWRTEIPEDLKHCIIQGPHILNATPFAQQPRPNCRSKGDWDLLDLETLPEDFIPRTNYQSLVSKDEFEHRQPFWDGRPYSSRYRSVHRGFVDIAGVRTLQSGIIPPGVTQIHALSCFALETNLATVRWVAAASSLPIDYLFKVGGNGHVSPATVDALPILPANETLDASLVLRALRLNCQIVAFAPLWSELYDESWREDAFESANDATVRLGDVESSWSSATPLRTDYDRWLAMCEIDALVALYLGITEQQLLQMYRSQFAILRKYETDSVFDGNGRQISGIHHAYGFRQAQWETELKAQPSRRGETRQGMWARVQCYIAGNTTIDLGPFIPPFRLADRETAMSRAYKAFTVRMETAQ
jgi:hypothetical protein